MQRFVRGPYLAVILLLWVCNWAATAWPLTTGSMADGFLVPLARFNSSDATDTVVGIICVQDSGSIYWTFFSAQGVPLANGSFSTGKNYIHGFSLSIQAPVWEDMPGYLIFTFDDDGTLGTGESRAAIGGNAVLVSIRDNDAAFIPCIPLNRADYVDEDLDLTNLTATSLVDLGNGTPSAMTDKVRYWVDPAFAAQTEIVIWTLNSAVGSGQSSIDNGKGSSATVTLNLTNSRLNILQAQTLWGRPYDYVEGTVAISSLGTPHVIFSLVSSAIFDAIQTFLALSYSAP